MVPGHTCVHVRVHVCVSRVGENEFSLHPMVLPDFDLLEDVNSKYLNKHNVNIKKRGRKGRVCRK